MGDILLWLERALLVRALPLVFLLKFFLRVMRGNRPLWQIDTEWPTARGPVRIRLQFFREPPI